jgi:hypothetical protein
MGNERNQCVHGVDGGPRKLSLFKHSSLTLDSREHIDWTDRPVHGFFSLFYFWGTGHSEPVIASLDGGVQG